MLRKTERYIDYRGSYPNRGLIKILIWNKAKQ